MFGAIVAFYGMIAFGAYGAGDVAGRVARWAAVHSRWVFYLCAAVLFVLWCVVFWWHAREMGEAPFMLISIIMFSVGTADYRPRRRSQE